MTPHRTTYARVIGDTVRAMPSARATHEPSPDGLGHTVSVPIAPRDKTGRPIMVGDVLKVYHFQGARWRKHYFMFKQVVGTKVLGKSGHPYLVVSHLNMKDPLGPDGGYFLRQDGSFHCEMEIVQGLDWHHDRPRTAQGIEAGTAETGTGSVHESPVPAGDAPDA